jgi:hypothetical protein
VGDGRDFDTFPYTLMGREGGMERGGCLTSLLDLLKRQVSPL